LDDEIEEPVKNFEKKIFEPTETIKEGKAERAAEKYGLIKIFKLGANHV